MEHRIIFATGNAGKMKEVRMILGELGIPVLSMKEAGIAADIVENGKSFEENAVIKAETIRDLTADGDLVLADDSGLEMDYLDGAPGIYSARFMGEDTCYTIKNTALVEKLAGVPEEKRTARFVCAVCCILESGEELCVQGECEGTIAFEPVGEGGFGYDPVFLIEDGRSFAQLTDREKDGMSHRGRALKKLQQALRERESGQ